MKKLLFISVISLFGLVSAGTREPCVTCIVTDTFPRTDSDKARAISELITQNVIDSFKTAIKPKIDSMRVVTDSLAIRAKSVEKRLKKKSYYTPTLKSDLTARSTGGNGTLYCETENTNFTKPK